jgi:hypothetical protein
MVIPTQKPLDSSGTASRLPRYTGIRQYILRREKTRHEKTGYPTKYYSKELKIMQLLCSNCD